MTSMIALPRTADAPHAATADARAEVRAAIDGACARIAPLWPLKHFVAVNPFLGFTGMTFDQACAAMRRVARTDMLMPRAFYRAAHAEGRITDEDLSYALLVAPAGAPTSLPALKAAMSMDDPAEAPPAVVATVAEVLDRLALGDRHASRTAFMIDEISKWCAAYFDEGQAAWRLPTRGMPAYAAWRATMRHDRNPEAMGIRRFRASVAAMPADPEAAIAFVVQALGIPARALEDYLFRALFDVGGWAAYARYRLWNAELDGRSDDILVQLLAIRVVWGYALYQERDDAAFHRAWAEAMAAAAVSPCDDRLGHDPALATDLVLQRAYEIAYQRQLSSALSLPVAPRVAQRPAAQAAFCIDVRSEVFRRALETVAPGVQTIGFAGFFGFAIEYVPIGRDQGGAQCPVLLKPAFTVCEGVRDVTPAEEARILSLRLLRRRAAKAWKAFKLSAVSSFAYVESTGLAFAAKLVGDSSGLTRPVHDPDSGGLDTTVLGRRGPRLDPRTVGGRATGLAADQRLAMAETVLNAMSLVPGDLARIVVLAGHGATTVNNPHASGLDCGACGGHTGEANARVAAAVMNDPAVRTGLAARGLAIPDDTWFLAALHDTTTDEVRLFDTDLVPAGHATDLAVLRAQLDRAAALTRMERACLLGAGGAGDIHADIHHRSRDWSQVRPEWGLAGCAAFIAAPRARTRGLDLGGRAFLHDYDWQADRDFKVLDLIMTAPMVVASWISLQYYGSTVNNRAFGAGDKTLHNVTGLLGVLEGNAGDLRTGLPLQSVHDGTRFVHEPMRLNVFIAAPIAAIDGVIARTEGVRALVDNGWLHLFALDDGAAPPRRYLGNGLWQAA